MNLTGMIPASSNAMSLTKLTNKHFSAAFISGRLAARTLIGHDDEGLLSLSEYAQFFRNLRAATKLPLIADAQSGFGNALNTFETSQELTRSGANYILLNDQKYPSKSTGEKTSISNTELLGKIKAAQDGMKGSSTQLIIKLEGLAQLSLDNLMERIKILQKFKIDNILLSNLNMNQLKDLLSKNNLPALGYFYDDNSAPLQLIQTFRPDWIIDLKTPLTEQNRSETAMINDDYQYQTEANFQASPTPNFQYQKFAKMRKQFKKAVTTKGNLIDMVVAPDSLSAKIAESLGFKAIFTAGYATSASNLAKPDRGLADFGIMLNKCREIINSVNLPVFADADTGYGDINNVARTVQSYENIGACGIFLEDQAWPKRCGHMAGKKVEPTETLIDKIKTAVKTRKHDDFLIMARTDAREIYGLDEAIKRGKSYAAAGADMVFIEAPKNINELKLEKEAFPNTPLMANMLEGGETPILSHLELQKLGFSIVVHPTALTYGQTYATREILSTLKNTGSTLGEKERMLSFDEFNEFIGLEEVNSRENKYTNAKMQTLLENMKQK